MAICFCIALVIAGGIIYYFEYTPAPKDASKKDLWKDGVLNGIIGTSMIITGAICLFCEDHVSSYVDNLNDFWTAFVIIATLGAGFYIPWIIRIIKKKTILHKQTK